MKLIDSVHLVNISMVLLCRYAEQIGVVAIKIFS